MQNTILIVEDDSSISDLLCDALTQKGLLCTAAFSGTEALLYCKTQPFDLILLDLMLPGLSGEEVLKRVKPLTNSPVVILSAIDELDSKVDLLRLGAEDYITKPFALEELLARVAVQLRKNKRGGKGDTLSYRALELDKRTRTVRFHGQEICLTRQEFKILELLLQAPSRVFSKQDIYDYAWGEAYMGEDKTINVHISNIRQKLKRISPEDCIETVWGIGFKLAEEDSL